MSKGKIIKEIDRTLIEMDSSSLMKLYHKAKVEKDTKRMEEIERAFRSRDIKVVNRTLHGN